MADQFRTDRFHAERVVLEFIEAEVEARMKEYGITLKVDGVVWDIDNVVYHGGELEVIALTRKDRRKVKRGK
jgi:hypothetical protein